MQVKGVMPQKSGLTRQTPPAEPLGSSKHGITFWEASERLCHFYFLIQRNQAVEAGRSYAFAETGKKSIDRGKEGGE